MSTKNDFLNSEYLSPTVFLYWLIQGISYLPAFGFGIWSGLLSGAIIVTSLLCLLLKHNIMMRSIGIVVFTLATIALLATNILLVMFFGFQISNLLFFILLLLNAFSIYMIFHITNYN